jgi:hypothetical protein
MLSTSGVADEVVTRRSRIVDDLPVWNLLIGNYRRGQNSEKVSAHMLSLTTYRRVFGCLGCYVGSAGFACHLSLPDAYMPEKRRPPTTVSATFDGTNSAAHCK